MALTNGRNFDDMAQLMRVLEEGYMLTRFFKRRLEKKIFQVKLETRQLIWTRNIGTTLRPEGVGKHECSLNTH